MRNLYAFLYRHKRKQTNEMWDVESRVMSWSNAVYHKSIGSTMRRITHTHCALPKPPPPLSEYAYNIPYIRALSTSQLICCTRRALFIWIHIYQVVRREAAEAGDQKKVKQVKEVCFQAKSSESLGFYMQKV